MTNEEIYENVMGHKPNKEFGIKGLFSWDDIDALMNAVKNCSIPAVVNHVACEHEEHTMQGNGFTYVVCAKCGIDL